MDCQLLKKYDIMHIKIEEEVMEKAEEEANKSMICDYNRTVWTHP